MKSAAYIDKYVSIFICALTKRSGKRAIFRGTLNGKGEACTSRY